MVAIRNVLYKTFVFHIFKNFLPISKTAENRLFYVQFW